MGSFSGSFADSITKIEIEPTGCKVFCTADEELCKGVARMARNHNGSVSTENDASVITLMRSNRHIVEGVSEEGRIAHTLSALASAASITSEEVMEKAKFSSKDLSDKVQEYMDGIATYAAAR